jgi:hypothetical protein
MAEHSIDLRHLIQIQDTRMLATRSRSMERIIREEKEIVFQPENMNREESFSFSKSWKPLLQTLKEKMKAPSLRESDLNGFDHP